MPMSDESQARDELFELLLDAINDVPRQLQQMIDSVVAVQEVMPMPVDGWEQFKRDIGYTNEKYGLNLTI